MDALSAVPEDALLVVAIEDLDSLRARAAESAWAEFLADPGVSPFVDEVGRLLEEALAESEEANVPHFDPGAWWSALHGPVRAYLALDAELAGTGGLFVGLTEERAALDELVESMWTAAASAGVASSTSYQDVAIDLLEKPAPEEGGEAEVMATFECAGQLAFVVGEGRERVLLAVHGAVDRLAGRDPSPGFAARTALTEARAAAGHRAGLEVFLDPALLTERLLADAEREGTDVELARRVCQTLGLLSARWIYGGADVGAGEQLDLTLAMQLGDGGMLREASELLGPLPSALLALVPPDSANVTLGRVDVAGLWELLQDFLEEIEPDAYARMRAGLEQIEPMFGFDVEADLIDRIRGDYLNFDVLIPADEVPPEVVATFGEESRDAFRRGTLQRYGLDEAADVADVLESFLEMSGMGADVESSEYQGRWIHSLPPFAHWCFTDEELLVSQTPTPLRTVLARLGTTDAPSIAGDARFRAALERHPAAAILGLGDTRTNLLLLLSVGQAMGPAIVSDLESEDAEAALELLSLLPPPETVRAHFDGVTSSAIEVRSGTIALRMSSR